MTSPAAWRDEAACIGKPVEWFFPVTGGTGCYRRGMEVCASCPVILECRADHAAAERELRMPLPGLWGGRFTETGTRQKSRQASPATCVVCGDSFPDKGTGIRPRFCNVNCLNRAAYRRRTGQPEADASAQGWSA